MKTFYSLIILSVLIICHYFSPNLILPIFSAFAIFLLINIADNLYDIGNEIIKQLRIIKMRQSAFIEATERCINKNDHLPNFLYDDPCDSEIWKN